jgi:hypothetical protein
MDETVVRFFFFFESVRASEVNRTLLELLENNNERKFIDILQQDSRALSFAECGDFKGISCPMDSGNQFPFDKARILIARSCDGNNTNHDVQRIVQVDEIFVQ